MCRCTGSADGRLWTIVGQQVAVERGPDCGLMIGSQVAALHCTAPVLFRLPAIPTAQPETAETRAESRAVQQAAAPGKPGPAAQPIQHPNTPGSLNTENGLVILGF